MTPPLRWVFLLALVGRAVSNPVPHVDDACALLCQPMAKSSPKGVCELWEAQSGSVLDQARIIIGRCLKLCGRQLAGSVEVNCHVLRHFLGNHRKCHYSSMDMMSSRAEIPSLVSKLAEDIVSAISSSPSDGRVICALHAEIFSADVDAEEVGIGAACRRLTRNDNENVKSDGSDVEQPSVDHVDQDKGMLEGDSKVTTASSNPEEATVDWEMWCMSQCSKGRGGNACRCDLIP